MLTFAQPRAIRSRNCSVGQPGAAVQRHRDAGRLDQVGDPLVRRAPAPRCTGRARCRSPGRSSRRPVRRMKSTATSRRLLRRTPRPSRRRPRRPGCPRSRPRRARRAARASATTSMVCRRFSATSSSCASNSTEFQPPARQSVITARSGQWSRCSATGTVDVPTPAPGTMSNSCRPAVHAHRLHRGLQDDRRPLLAPPRRARPRCVRSLTMLKAATPYRSANARSRISFIATTGTKPPQTCSAGSAPRRRDASETLR